MFTVIDYFPSACYVSTNRCLLLQDHLHDGWQPTDLQWWDCLHTTWFLASSNYEIAAFFTLQTLSPQCGSIDWSRWTWCWFPSRFPMLHADSMSVVTNSDQPCSCFYLCGFDVSGSCQHTSFPNGTHLDIWGVTEFKRGQSWGIGTQSVSCAIPETSEKRAHIQFKPLKFPMPFCWASHWIMDNINEGAIYVFSSLGSNRGFNILNLLSSP